MTHHGPRTAEFELVRELGKGTFAHVWAARRKRDGRLYAVKIVELASMKPREVSDTLTEIRFLASLRHPHVVTYHESFLDPTGAQLWLVMEYASLGDLAGLVERHAKAGTRVSEAQVWAFAIQLLEALAYLHKKRILHRDIKVRRRWGWGEEGRVNKSRSPLALCPGCRARIVSCRGTASSSWAT